MCSVFLQFKGGKGVATSTGVFLGLYPYYTIPGLAAAIVFVAVFKTTRYVSVASVLGSTCFPIAYVVVGLCWRPAWPLLHEQLPLLVFSIVMALLIVMKHRTNLARLRAGTEHRFKRA